MKKTHQSLIREDRYQVFLLSNPSRLLLFTHPWFVVNRKGVISRWAIGLAAFRGNPRYGWINKDALPPFSGVPFLFPFASPWLAWRPTLHGYVEGGEGSLAARMAACIENSKDTYPYRDTYFAKGPNCNTYIQWVLDQFPEADMHLPWNAIGKGFSGLKKLKIKT